MRYIGAVRDVAAYLDEQVTAGDVVITLGAGDGYKIGEWPVSYTHLTLPTSDLV